MRYCRGVHLHSKTLASKVLPPEDPGRASSAAAEVPAPVAVGPELVGSFLLVALENRPEEEQYINTL